MNFIIIYTTCQTREEAEKIISTLLEKKLIACGGVHAAQSLYQWKGDRHSNDEVAVMMESVASKFDEAASVIEELHSYEEPAILSWKIHQTSDTTRRWLEDVLRVTLTKREK